MPDSGPAQLHASRRVDRWHRALARLLEQGGAGLALARIERDQTGCAVDGTWRLVGAGAGRLLGQDPAALVGRRLRATLPAPPAEAILAAYGRCVEGREAAATVATAIGHLRLVASGDEVAMQIEPAPAPADLRSLIHDANNHWAVVAGHLQLLERRLADRPEDLASLARALRAAFRGALHGERLRALLGPWRLAPEPLELNGLLDSWCATVLPPLLGPDIRVVRAGAGSPVACRTDRDRLEMALLELALDACERLTGGGLLTLRAEATPPACGPAAVAIAIADDGGAIDAGIAAAADSLAALFAAASGGRLELRPLAPGLERRLVLPAA